MTDLDLFFRYLNGRCHGNRFCAKNSKLPTFVALAFRNGMGYRCLKHTCILCENIVKFGPVIPPYESALRADAGRVAFFPIYPGTLPWQPISFAKMYQRRLIPPPFGALELENELQYHGLAMRVNSAYDACISSENFVKFGLVTAELTGLICERQV